MSVNSVSITADTITNYVIYSLSTYDIKSYLGHEFQVRISFSNVIYQYLECISLVVKYAYFITYNIHIV